MCNLAVQSGAGVMDGVGEVVADGDGEGDGDGESDAVVGGPREGTSCDVACAAAGWLSSVLAIANIPATMPAMTPPSSAKSPATAATRTSVGCELYQLLIPTVHAPFFESKFKRWEQ